MTEEQKSKRREANRLYMQEYLAKKRQDPSWIEAQRKYHREYAREWSSDPEHRERIRSRNQAQYQKRISDPERHEIEKARQRAKYHRYKHSASQKRWNRSLVCKSKGITVDQFETMLDAQNGACAICGGTQGDQRRKHLAIDHCHASGKVRGLLCDACNVGLGSFRDDVERLRKAISYLETHTT